MKIQLKKFPNGAHFNYSGLECVRLSRDANVIVVQIVVSGFKLLLHPDTYVEPIQLNEHGK